MKSDFDQVAELVIVGQGTPEQGADFDRTHGRGLVALVDSGRVTYKLLGYVRGVMKTLGPQSVLSGVRAASQGFMQGSTQGDPFQQGGVLIVAPDGRPVYFFRSAFAGDHPDPRRVLEAAQAVS